MEKLLNGKQIKVDNNLPAYTCNARLFFTNWAVALYPQEQRDMITALAEN